MSFRLILRPEAEVDIGDAATWYEEQRAGLGSEFVEAVFRAIDALSVNPLLTSRRHRRRNIRWVFPDRFPYRIIYEVANDTVLVISVLHAARHDPALAREIDRRSSLSRIFKKGTFPD